MCCTPVGNPFRSKRLHYQLKTHNITDGVHSPVGHIRSHNCHNASLGSTEQRSVFKRWESLSWSRMCSPFVTPESVYPYSQRPTEPYTLSHLKAINTPHILFKISFNIIDPSVPHVSQVGSYFQVPRLQLYTAYVLSFFTTCLTHISLLDCTTITAAYLENSINNEALHPAIIFMFLLFLSATRSQTQPMVFSRVKDHVKHLC